MDQVGAARVLHHGAPMPLASPRILQLRPKARPVDSLTALLPQDARSTELLLRAILSLWIVPVLLLPLLSPPARLHSTLPTASAPPLPDAASAMALAAVDCPGNEPLAQTVPTATPTARTHRPRTASEMNVPARTFWNGLAAGSPETVDSAAMAAEAAQSAANAQQCASPSCMGTAGGLPGTAQTIGDQPLRHESPNSGESTQHMPAIGATHASEEAAQMAAAAAGAPAAAADADADTDTEEDGRSAAPRASSCGEEKRSWSSHGSDEDDLAVAMRLGRAGDSRQMAERESNRLAARAGPLMREDAPTAAVGGSGAGVPEDLSRSSPAIGLVALAMIVELSRCHTGRQPASIALLCQLWPKVH